ncbi:MAG: ATP-dependent Clp protease ATP-binding subunit ClpX [bacterium]|nr:ATP-dependent Clp protease ATP-binding subunit ClpX [bacterium]
MSKYPRCAFCPTTDYLIVVNEEKNQHICVECLMSANKYADNETSGYDSFKPESLPKPSIIKSFLDRFVVGQEHAKRVLAVEVCNHHKRTHLLALGPAPEISKANILLIGPTGTGKTLLARTLAKFLNVPFAQADANTMTEAGYVGEDVESMLLRLYQAAGGDVARAEKGVIYLDEVDKIGKRDPSSTLSRDASHEGVQQGLLKILEGTVANVPLKGGPKHPQGECVQMDTTNILFICGGAFVGLEKIIAKRLEGKAQMGFLSKPQEAEHTDAALLHKVDTADLLRYGLIPEFIGRLPVIGVLDSLKKEDLVRVLTEPEDALIRYYRTLCRAENVELNFTDGALDIIAEHACRLNVGARGLRRVMEDFMRDFMFELPDCELDRFVIDEEFVRGAIAGKPVCLKQKPKAARALLPSKTG